jgi:hypothetical protein
LLTAGFSPFTSECAYHDPKSHHPGIIKAHTAIRENPGAADFALAIPEKGNGLINGCDDGVRRIYGIRFKGLSCGVDRVQDRLIAKRS